MHIYASMLIHAGVFMYMCVYMCVVFGNEHSLGDRYGEVQVDVRVDRVDKVTDKRTGMRRSDSAMKGQLDVDRHRRID